MTQLLTTILQEIERLKKRNLEREEYDLGWNDGLEKLLAFLDTLEQQDELIVTAVAFLDALSQTPYNNKPITDAQVIVKQLLIFLDNPKLYDPDAISKLEQQEVDLEKEIDKTVNECTDGYDFDWDKFARHFYELGKNAK